MIVTQAVRAYEGRRRFLDVDARKTQLEQTLDREALPPLRHADYDPIRTPRGDDGVQVSDRAEARRGDAVTIFGARFQVADRRQSQFRALLQP